MSNPLVKTQDKTIEKHSFNPHMPINKFLNNYSANSYPTKNSKSIV